MSSKSAFCANCGNDMAGQQICTRCGTVAGQPNWAPPVSSPATSDKSTPPVRSRNFVIPVVAVVCIAALVALKVYDSRDSNPSTSPQTATPVATNTGLPATSASSPESEGEGEGEGDSESRITQPPVITASIDPCPYPLQFVDALPWGTCTKGFAVQLLQDRLVYLGYRLAADSYFGPETEIALIQFQRDNYLDETGIVDLNTWATLFYGVELPGYDYNYDGVITPDELVYD